MLLSTFLLIIFIALGIFYVKFSNKIPILMYHRIANVHGDRNSLPPEKFEQQLQYLHSKGYTSINMDQLYAHYVLGEKLPPKSVVLSFDDGYADNLYTAMPIMQKYNMIGNVFVIANWIGKENKWENFGKAPTVTMTEQELQEWQNAGNYIGSHTVSHPNLNLCDKLQLIEELSHSKKSLDLIAGTDIKSICYPYGNFNNLVIEAAREAGYKIGLAIFNQAPIWNFNILALPRIPIPSGQKMWEFKLKVSKLHMLFVILRQVERKTKKLFR
jgi:peptidoglycan/xylan/chitin deacetylase (PgdA/CDA1 family)